jgi:hypothetical protein
MDEGTTVLPTTQYLTEADASLATSRARIGVGQRVVPLTPPRRLGPDDDGGERPLLHKRTTG